MFHIICEERWDGFKMLEEGQSRCRRLLWLPLSSLLPPPSRPNVPFIQYARSPDSVQLAVVPVAMEAAEVGDSGGVRDGQRWGDV